jgi:predicted secreted protein
MKSRLRILISLLLVAIIAVFSISNKAAVAQSDRSEISYEEKLKRWNSFSEEKKAKIRKLAQEMSEEKFKTLKANYKKLKKFEPQEQKRIKENFNRFKEFKQQKRKQIRQNFNQFKNFKPERRQQLRKKFIKKFEPKKIPQNQRRGINQRRNAPGMRKIGPGNNRQNNLRNKRPGQNGRPGLGLQGQRKNRPNTNNRQLNNRNRQQRPGKRPGGENNKPRQIRKAPDSNRQGFQRNDQQFQRRNERPEVNRYRRNFGDSQSEEQRGKPDGSNRRWSDVQKFREGFSEAYGQRRRPDSGQNGVRPQRPGRAGENTRPAGRRQPPDRMNQRRERPGRPTRQGRPGRRPLRRR